MFLLYSLDTYTNLVKYYQNVPLDVSINWCYLHQDAEKTYSEISNMRSYWKCLKATNSRHKKKNIGDSVVTKEKSVKTTKTVCFRNEKCLTTSQALAGRDGKIFCKKRVLVKVGIPPSISDETVHRLLQKTDLKWTHF